MDLGYSNVGVSVITEKEEIFAADFKLRTDIQERLSERRMYRRNKRNRLRYRQPRFLNRKRDYKDAPSIRHKFESHVRIINLLTSIMPIDNIIFEIANFDAQKINNPEIHGKGYQQGAQLGYQNVKEYVKARDRHTCHFNDGKCCKRLEVHHIIFKKNKGTDKPSNLVTVCKHHHSGIHSGKYENPKSSKNKSLRPTSFMNTVSKRIQEMFPDCGFTYGYETKQKRYALGLEKSHTNDAFVIANGTNQRRLEPEFWAFKRKNNRRLGSQRKGFAPSSRKQRYPIQPKAIIEYEGKLYITSGTHCKGKRIMISVDGKRKSIAVKKIKLIYNARTIFKLAV